MIGYHSLDQRKVTPSSLIESVFLFLELVASDTKHGGLANHIPRAVDQGCLSGPSTLIHLQWGNGWWIKKTKNGIQEIKVAALWVNQHFVMFLTSPTQQPKNGIVVIVVVWWMLLRMFLGCLVAWFACFFHRLVAWLFVCLIVSLLVCCRLWCYGPGACREIVPRCVEHNICKNHPSNRFGWNSPLKGKK